MARATEIVRYQKAFAEYSEEEKEPQPRTAELQEAVSDCLRNIDQRSTVSLADIMENE
jgi:hypothetical protein